MGTLKLRIVTAHLMSPSNEDPMMMTVIMLAPVLVIVTAKCIAATFVGLLITCQDRLAHALLHSAQRGGDINYPSCLEYKGAQFATTGVQ